MGSYDCCKFEVSKNGADTVKKLVFTNLKREIAGFNLNILNCLLKEVNSFTRKVKSMSTQQNHKLLSFYLELVQRSAGFINHEDGHHDKYGFSIDSGAGVMLEDLEKEGGSLDSYLDFVNSVKESALNAGRFDDNLAAKRKPSGTTEGPAAKVSRKDTIAKHEDEELTDKQGLEVNLRKSYVGVSNVLLDNISVHPELAHIIVNDRVSEIEELMRKKYDPSQAVLVICPVDTSAPLDKGTRGSRKYFVVQKLHTFKGECT